MVEDIAFYVLYKSRVLIIRCKAIDFCLFLLSVLKNLFFGYKNKCSEYEVEKVSIRQHFSKSGKHRHTLF